MHNLELFMMSLDYIEEHLTDDLKTEDIAKACYCSKSTLDKLFRNVNRMAVKDYVIRRRMTLAGRALLNRPDESILNIALEYGYGTHEAFTRAFKSVWNCKPSEFRNRKYYELFPKVVVPPFVTGEEYLNMPKRVDISELYELFVERKNCYFVCCDIKSLIPINEISFKAGDLSILESLNRMNNAAGQDDVVFRIGGDEFCMLTASEDAAYAEKIAEEIRSHNTEPFDYEGMAIPLSLYVTTTKIDSNRNLKYDQLFATLHEAIMDYKPEVK